jgi:hypothetical protein
LVGVHGLAWELWDLVEIRFQREPELGSAGLVWTLMNQGLFEPLICAVRERSKRPVGVGLRRLTGQQLVDDAREELGRSPALNPSPVLLERDRAAGGKQGHIAFAFHAAKDQAAQT